MPIVEVRRLVTRFESNRKAITPLQSKLDKLQRDYRNAWNKIRTECEKTGHDGKKDGGNVVHFSATHCPYCRKQLFPVTAPWNAWNPESIFDAEYCNYWLNIDEKDWPADKRKMLQRVKTIIKNYFKESGPVISSLKILRAEQADIEVKLQEVFELCDSVLGITLKHEDEMRAYRRVNRKAPPFNDPDAFKD